MARRLHSDAFSPMASLHLAAGRKRYTHVTLSLMNTAVKTPLLSQNFFVISCRLKKCSDVLSRRLLMPLLNR